MVKYVSDDRYKQALGSTDLLSIEGVIQNVGSCFFGSRMTLEITFMSNESPPNFHCLLFWRSHTTADLLNYFGVGEREGLIHKPAMLYLYGDNPVAIGPRDFL